MSRRPRSTALTGALAVLGIGLVAFVVVMSQNDYRRTGTSNKIIGIAVDLPPGKQLCQPQLYVPSGTGAARLRVTPGGPGAGPLALSVRRGSDVLTSGRSGTGFANGFLDTRLARVDELLQGVSLCIRNGGRVAVSIHGEAGPGGPAYVETDVPVPTPIALKVDWLTPKPRTYWRQAGAVADRFWLEKASWFGAWTLWAAIFVLIVTAAAAIRLAVREPGQ